jgi:antitoxin component of MazEF toxin-antitoxin module
VATVYPGGLGSVALVDNTNITNYSRDNSGMNAVSQQNTDNLTGFNLQPGQSLRGTITSMAGDNVTVTLADGSTQTIAIPRIVQENLNLQPGTSITARRLSNGNVAIAIGNDIEGSSSAANTYSTDMSSSSRTNNSTDNIRLGSNPYGNVVAQQVVTGTITAINGDSISISGADNTTQTVNINPALLDRLNLRVGSPVSIMTMSDGSVRVARGVNSDASPIGENPTTLDSSNMISTPQQRRVEQYPLSRNAQSNYNLRNTTIQQTQNSTNTTSDNQNNNSTNDNSNTQNNSGVRALW